jgi:peptide/nickel transport system substrate-binding protein
MMQDFVYGRSLVMDSYLPPNHPLYPDEIAVWPYDVAAANQLLDEAGYRDANHDGYREDPGTGEIFRFTVSTTDLYQINRQIVAQVGEDLRECGLVVETEILPAELWYSGGESSKLFGRRFDLGHLALPIRPEPLCGLCTSWEITGPADTINHSGKRPFAGWDGLNSTGWWDGGYDEACATAVSAWPDTAEYAESHAAAQQIFAQNMPMIPLFPRLKFATAVPQVQGFQLDSTQESELWNLFALDLSPPDNP